jgi:hypothetical protein
MSRLGSGLGLPALDGNTGTQINGEAASDQFGSSVASGGDTNGDGFGDFIVGAFTANANGTDSGVANGVNHTDFFVI